MSLSRAPFRAAAVLLLAAAGLEGLARLVSPPLDPSEYLVAEPDDERFHCCVGPHPYLAGAPAATRFDPSLLWSVNGRPIIRGRGADDLVVVALGDGFTWGPAAPRTSWPGILQELVDMNRAQGRVHVRSAAVPGYTSLQGLLAYREREDLGADVVVVGFGADDARPVARSDASWLARARSAATWGRSRALAIGLRWAWSLAPEGPRSFRVPLDAYERNLRELVRLARARGAQPVLLTRPYRRSEPLPAPLAALPRYNEAVRAAAAETATPCLDLDQQLAGDDTSFVDAVRPSPAGLRRVAEALLRHLRSLGLLDSAHRFASGGRPADWNDDRPELASGFWPAEPWPGREPGRWTAGEARLVLERRADEGGLLLDLTLHNGRNHTSGRIEVSGQTLLRFARPNGPLVRIVDIRRVQGPVIEARFVTDGASPPGESPDGIRDPRVLGVFVHRVALVPGRLADTVDLASLDDDRPELGAGWLAAEVWPDRRRGRWTGERADLRLGRPPGHDVLLVDLSLESPRGDTQGVLEVNGRRMERFGGENGPRRLRVDLKGVPGDELRVRLAVERTFRPGADASGARDDRELGVFVHVVRLVTDRTVGP
jgi:lysophospholipase L1-like esterase